MSSIIFSVLRLSGEKAAVFLQGQLTCDVRLLTHSKQYTLAACCDHRGRMIANFWVMKWDNDFLLILPKNMLELTKSHLHKYAVFSKVLLSEALDFQVDYHDELRVTQTATPIIASVSTHIFIEKGLVILQPKTSLLFTPAMINLDKLGGVSFDKGCYVGQEIVARTEHLGTLKRHLRRLQLNTDSLLNPGDPLMKDNTEIGTIALTHCHNDSWDLLAVVEDRYQALLS